MVRSPLAGLEHYIELHLRPLSCPGCGTDGTFPRRFLLAQTPSAVRSHVVRRDIRCQETSNQHWGKLFGGKLDVQVAGEPAYLRKEKRVKRVTGFNCPAENSMSEAVSSVSDHVVRRERMSGGEFDVNGRLSIGLNCPAESSTSRLLIYRVGLSGGKVHVSRRQTQLRERSRRSLIELPHTSRGLDSFHRCHDVVAGCYGHVVCSCLVILYRVSLVCPANTLTTPPLWFD